MTEKEQGNIQSINARRLPVRLGLGLAVVLALVFGWFTVRWQLGNMLAELTLPTEPNAGQIADLAASLAPGDPLAKWLKANTGKEMFTPESISRSLAAHQEIVRAAPYNFSWWVELGRAYEQAEQTENAERAFRRAVELAPAYTYPHWQLGNFYLRQDQDEKAFAELKKAAENNAIYREQVFSIAWDYYENDTKRLEQIAGNLPDVRAGLAKFYAAKERPAESLRMWDTLSAEEKKANEEVARLIAQALYDKQFYRQAVEFVRDLRIDPEAGHEKVQNGGFENKISAPDKTYFGWKVTGERNVDVKIDPTQRHEGQRSLRAVFNGFDRAELYNISQIITVEPGARYGLSFWLKTKELKSSGMPVLEIVDVRNNKIIAASESFPTGTNEWKRLTVEFTVPEAAEALMIRTTRAFCGDACPLVGIFWYDDFRLEKIE